MDELGSVVYASGTVQSNSLAFGELSWSASPIMLNDGRLMSARCSSALGGSLRPLI